jgi:hypothetical protein
MEEFTLTDGKKEVKVLVDGDEITFELIKGFPVGARSEDFADALMKDIAIKDKVSHKPHIHTTEGQVIYTGA